MRLRFTAIVAVSLLLLTLPARAADWGPLMEKALEHLVRHMSMEAAKKIVEYATRGERVPPLEVTPEMLEQLARAQLVDCIRRAKWLDDNAPRNVELPEGSIPRIVLGYPNELADFHKKCDPVLGMK